MPLNAEMTWERAKLRWRKMYRGVIYTVSCRELGVPATKEASYRAANAWWARKRAELEAEASPVPHAKELEALRLRRDWARGHGEGEVAESLTEEIGRIEQGDAPREEWKFTLKVYQQVFGLDPGSTPPELLRHLFDGSDQVWDDRLDRGPDSPAIPDDLTIGGQVEAWIARQEARVHTGEVSAGRHENVSHCIRHFRDFCGSELPVERIDAGKLEAYYLALSAEVRKRREDSDRKAGMSNDYAAKHLTVAKTFIRYIWSKELITLPRNIDSKGFGFRKAPRAVPTMAVEDVRSLVEYATGQLKLHLLLMVNCGMTQTDIADLKDDEVDWEGGRVIRKRSKTGSHDDVPLVNYPLWTPTATLLKQYRSGGEIVLVTKSGARWAWEELVDGKYKSSDNIATNYFRLRAKLKKQGTEVGPLKLLRKTSATKIESHREYGRYASHFLGHSPRTIKDRHYAAPSQELFDEIIAWLGDWYGYTKA